MIDMVEENQEFDISPLTPALDEFEDLVKKSLEIFNYSNINQRLNMEARIYGELVQVLDKHGLRTYGLATAVRKLRNHYVVDVIITEPAPKSIREIKIPVNRPGK